MDGLIKGLVNVALDAIEGGGRNADAGEQEPSHENDRSRSSWAEVVSSGHGEHCGGGAAQPPDLVSCNIHQEEESGGRSRRQHHNAAGMQQQYQKASEETGTGAWEAVSSNRRHGHPMPQHWQEYKKPASEQEYSADVHRIHQGLSVEPAGEELESLAKACARLWDLDMNRLVPGKDYRVELGEGKKVYQKGDMASEKLFSWVHEDILTRPTYSRFIALLDNYDPRQGYKENVSAEEKHEQVAFIEEISRTAPVKYVYRHLVSRGIIPPDMDEFKTMMQRLWFELYGRGGGHGSSSAFEHVFVGEIKGRRGSGEEDEVSGFHNWIQFYIEEAKGNVDYQGYIFPRHRGEVPCCETQLLTVQFTWHGVLKSVSSTLIGVSPEFEISLYTLCFFVGTENNRVHLGPYSVDVKCYRLGSNKIGSVFPVADN